MAFLTTLRTYWILSTKVLFLLVCGYYLINYKLFSVKIALFSFAKSLPLVDTIVTYFESFGLFLIIFPMSIVIISFLYPGSSFFKVSSMFIAVSGNIFSVVHLANSGLLEERFKAGPLLIYNQSVHEHKLALLKQTIDSNLTHYTHTVSDPNKFISYANDHIEKYWLNYSASLKKLRQRKYMPKDVQ